MIGKIKMAYTTTIDEISMLIKQALQDKLHIDVAASHIKIIMPNTFGIAFSQKKKVLKDILFNNNEIHF
jgi:hypothetical protein